MNAKCKEYKNFSKSNSTHDLAKWLLSMPNNQVRKIEWLDFESGGGIYQWNCLKHKVYLASVKMLKARKAKQ